MKKILLVSIVIFLLLGTLTFAKTTQNNGKPFKEIWAAIESIDWHADQFFDVFVTQVNHSNDVKVLQQQIDDLTERLSECCPILDTDGDGIPDYKDLCPDTYDPTNQDADGNEIGDVCQLFLCCDKDFECDELTLSECKEQERFVANCILRLSYTTSTLYTLVNFTIINESANAQWLSNLTTAVNQSGIPAKNYTPGTYDCDDFADDLEKNLTGKGYNATFTVYWCYDENGTNTLSHAVTDVHAPDGSLIFIEPQTGEIIDLDFDGDGTVETRDSHPVNITYTDDDCEIEVYGSRSEAVDAGVVMDQIFSFFLIIIQDEIFTVYVIINI